MFDLSAYITELETLVNIDSDSYNVAGVNAVGTFFVDRFTALGWDVQRVHLDPSVGDLLDIRNSATSASDVLIIGHMDTVFGPGEAARRPFTIADGKAYGPGVADMKCGLLTILHALSDLSKASNTLRIRVIMNPDEEIHSRYSTAYIKEAAKEAQYVFVLEPAMANGAFCVERKGLLDYQVTFTGIPTHAGYRYQRENASAIEEMAHWVTALTALGDKMLDTTVNVGVVAGGALSNIVAETATMHFEARMWDPAETARIKEAVNKLAATPFIAGVQCEVTLKNEKEVLQPTEETKAYLTRMEQLYHKKSVPFSYERSGGVSDANTAGVYAPVTVDRIGPWGDYNHSEKEYILLDSVEYAVTLLQAMLDEIAIHKEVTRQ